MPTPVLGWASGMPSRPMRMNVSLLGVKFIMKLDHPQIEIDALAAVIRESIAKQQNGSEIVEATDSAGDQSGRPIPQLKLQQDFHPRPDDCYHVNELLQYHDRVFLVAAYRAILKRSPDEAEFLRDRKRLQTGHFNKIDLLATLKSSPEGRAKGVQVDGLAIPALIRRLGRLPLLGYPMNLAIGIVRLPKQIRDQRQFADYVMAQHQHVQEFINAFSKRTSETSDWVSRQDETRRPHEAALATQEAGLARHEARLNDSNAVQNKIRHQQLEFETASGARFDALDQLIAQLSIQSND